MVAGGLVRQVGVGGGQGRSLAVPGFVDLQVNGFAGVDFLGADVAAYGEVGGALLRSGVTAFQPTFISSPPGAYLAALDVAGRAQSTAVGPRLLGVHLEGPFLSPQFAGAHDPAHLVDPQVDLADRLCDAGPVRYMTLAPERPGALDLIAHLVARGITVAVGHTDADAPTAHAAFDRGARAVTHIHNAQRRWRARDPGVAGAALARRDVVVQAIVDGVHLAPETTLAAFLAARGRFALVTDAIEAAGLPDGRYRLGDRDVTVNGGAARLADGTLAGSVLSMDAAVRNLVALGATIVEAVEAATRVPAGLVGRPELGTLRPGTPADLVVLDDDLLVQRTVVRGEEHAG
ncbi:MAG TPA: N-acetylglucosamine-6-phosphate deacetylase [Egibacteraceae bacterium]|nr:N-acetylglucosamine-6-phosphate deacetylase [Egibacteraceae bacterium]